MSVLVLDNVTYTYAGAKKRVLKGINASFEEGKLYVIMGKSGAGKSTLLSLISGLDTCGSGNILFQGNNILAIDRDDYRAKSIGVIYQGYNLLTNATAVENIILSMNISGVENKNKKEKAYQLLESVGISKEQANRKILKLSGGEQQRVGIARAISHNPSIIIADEPTGNLDRDTENTIMDILQKQAHDQNKCVIVVTHSKSVATYADETWGLNAGNLVYVNGQ